MRLFTSLSPRPAPSARQKLRAAVARRTARAPSIEEEEEEPTTSFRTALIVVLLLHVVAGAGIVMFERISNRHPAVAAEAAGSRAKKAAVAEAAANSSAAAVAAAAQGATRAKPGAAPVANSAEPVKKTASAPAAEVKDSGQVYIVVKGDTLVTISRRQKVVYEDLLKLNKIDDPKKLRIGQKLHLPVKLRASAN